MFVENKFDAPLTPGQPVGYPKALDPHPASVLAFIAPEHRIDDLWKELKGQCNAAKLEFAEDFRTADHRRIRVDRRTMLITSWKRVLDALQEAGGARPLGHRTGNRPAPQPCGTVNPHAD